MDNKNHHKIDMFIKDKLGSLNHKSYLIDPTGDFKARVMARIDELEAKRKFIMRIVLPIIMIAPLMLRQAWLLARNDYFSLGSLPFNDIISRAYRLFISPTGIYLAILISFAGAVVYLSGNRKYINLPLFR